MSGATSGPEVILAIDTVNATDWASLTPGFTWGVVLAVFSVIPPFLVWWRWPDGNARREQQKQRREAKDAAQSARKSFLAANPKREYEGTRKDRRHAAVVAGEAARKTQAAAIADRVAAEAGQEAGEKALRNAIRPEGHWSMVLHWSKWKETLGKDLKGFSEDWNMKDNWVSSIGLVAAVFTGVFTSTNALEGIVGPDATSTLTVIAVSAVLSAGLVGAGPIFLTIFKRRWVDDYGAARYNTVLGVLVASIVAMVGIYGLVLSIAFELHSGSVWALAGLSLVVLVLYSWKSLPMILAEGSAPPKERQSTTPLL